jgi:hypothetical protein
MAAEPAAAAPADRSHSERIDVLEEEVRALRAGLDDLRRQLGSG